MPHYGSDNKATFASQISWYVKSPSMTAHLFTVDGRSWCGMVKIMPLDERPFLTHANSNMGFKVCKRCQAIAKEMLGVEK